MAKRGSARKWIEKPRHVVRVSRPARSHGALHRPVATRPTGATDPTGRSYVELLGLKDTAPSSLVEAVRKGVPFSAFERFVATTQLSSADAATLVNIPTRTLTRRKQSGRLEPDESDRLLRASRLLGRTIDLFEGDRDAAKQWLARPQRALGGATPFDLAGTEVGALAVERLVDQLEHGIFV